MSTDDPLARYRREGQGPGAAVKPASSKEPYRPYELSSQEKRHLELRFKFPDPAECPSNFTLTNVRGEWRWGQSIALTYSKPMIVRIKGENLTELFRAIK